MYKDIPRTKKFISAVDPKHRYSNEAERANKDIYDDSKMKKTLWSSWFIQKYFSIVRVNTICKVNGTFCDMNFKLDSNGSMIFESDSKFRYNMSRSRILPIHQF